MGWVRAGDMRARRGMRFEDDVCEIGERGGGIDEWTNTKRRDRRRRYIRPPNYDRGVGLLKYKGQWDKRTIRVGRPVGGAAIVDSPSKLSAPSSGALTNTTSKNRSQAWSVLSKGSYEDLRRNSTSLRTK